MAVLRLRLALVASLVAILAACGGSAPSSGVTASQGASGAATAAPGATDEPAASDAPGTSEDPTATDEPTATDGPAATDGPSPSGGPGASESPSVEPGAGAEACSGSTSNREFFVGIAKVVEWPVLCGVLPKGWFVAQGSYRLANGGKLLISYKGPGGASIALSEGAWCTSADGCVPAGTELGATALGPLTGTLYQAADGFAILAAAGENPSWLMTTHGLDQATATSLAAALARVGR